ncbi:hypothetical protein [Flavobacterium sp. GCM10023249]|uniref:hypothetical protein n=1 Tax=unclassified Flavobacterium TaxID=196869 RepID=UPI003617DC99
MKPLLISIFCCLLLISCTTTEKNITEEVSDQDIYRVVKLVLKDISAIEKLEGTEDYYIIDALQTPSFVYENPGFELERYFTTEDIAGIKEQISAREHFTLLQDSIPSKRLLSRKIIDSFIDKNSTNPRESFLKNYLQHYGDTFYHSFSLPVFSKDKKTFLIDVSSINGGRSILYKNTNGKWKGKTVCVSS